MRRVWRQWLRWVRWREDPERIEREVDDELSFHLEMRARKLRSEGYDERRARDEALVRIGDYASVRAEVLVVDGWREQVNRGTELVRSVVRDIAHALRSLRRTPGFAAVVLLSLGLGIGANAAVFTLLDAVLLRPLPVRDDAGLVAVGDSRRVSSVSCCSPRVDLFSYPLYVELRDAVHSVGGLAAMGRTGRLDVQITGPDGVEEGTENPVGRLVSGNYFELLGVPAAAGRTFTESDDRVANGSPIVVISHDYWRSRLASDPGVVVARWS